MATLIKTNGKKIQIEPDNGTDFSLEELQKCVKGYIQIINMNKEEFVKKISELEHTLQKALEYNRREKEKAQ